METIKQVGDYSVIKNGKWYEVYHNDQVLKTPEDHVAHTLYLPIAEQLLIDWRDQGYDSHERATSLLAFHFITADIYGDEPRYLIYETFNSIKWEQRPPFVGNSSSYGIPDDMWNMFLTTKWQVRKWFSNLSIMQMSAVACVHDALNDMNIPFQMSLIVKNKPEKDHYNVVQLLHKYYSYTNHDHSLEDFWTIFQRFRLYYGIHVKEENELHKYSFSVHFGWDVKCHNIADFTLKLSRAQVETIISFLEEEGDCAYVYMELYDKFLYNTLNDAANEAVLKALNKGRRKKLEFDDVDWQDMNHEFYWPDILLDAAGIPH